MWEQFVEFLKGLGLKPPVDLTDPRLSPDDLKKVYADVREKFAARRQEKGYDIAELRRLGDAAKEVKAEIERRAESEKLAEGFVDLDAKAEEKPAEEPKAEGVVETKELDATLTVTDGSTGTEDTDDDTKSKELAAAAASALAAGGATQDAAERKGGVAGDNSYRPMVAGAAVANVADFAAPVTVTDVGAMLVDRIPSYKGKLGPSDPERRAVLASVLGYGDTPGYDKSKVLGSDPDANTSLIRQTLDAHTRAVLQAKDGKAPATAATFCAPFDVIREIPDATSTRTPFRDSLPFVPFRHGGFVFNEGVAFVDVANAVKIWTEANQDAVDPNTASTWKPCYDIVCGNTHQLRADNWLTACVSWKVGTDLNNPERVADVFRKVEGTRARLAEQYLLGLADPLMVNYLFPKVISSVPDFIYNVLATFSHAGYNQRLDPLTSYTMYLDTGILANLMIDKERMAFANGDLDAAANVLSEIRADLDDYVDRIVLLEDRAPGAYGTTGGAAGNGNPYSGTYPPAAGNVAGGTPPNLVTRYRVRIIPTGEVFAFGTGEIRTGIRQDFAMARQNKVGWFVEEAVQLGKFGTSPWFGLNMNLCPTGARVGWIDPTTVTCTVVPTNPS